MKKLLFFILITGLTSVCSLCKAQPQVVQRSTYVFKFLPGKALSFTPSPENEAQLDSLIGKIKTYRDPLQEGELYIGVSGYPSTSTQGDAARYMAFILSKLVKSERIIQGKAAESMFVIDKKTGLPPPEGLKDAVVFAFPASLKKVEKIAGRKAADKVRAYYKEMHYEEQPLYAQKQQPPASRAKQIPPQTLLAPETALVPIPTSVPPVTAPAYVPVPEPAQASKSTPDPENAPAAEPATAPKAVSAAEPALKDAPIAEQAPKAEPAAEQAAPKPVPATEQATKQAPVPEQLPKAEPVAEQAAPKPAPATEQATKQAPVPEQLPKAEPVAEQAAPKPAPATEQATKQVLVFEQPPKAAPAAKPAPESSIIASLKWKPKAAPAAEQAPKAEPVAEQPAPKTAPAGEQATKQADIAEQLPKTAPPAEPAPKLVPERKPDTRPEAGPAPKPAHAPSKAKQKILPDLRLRANLLRWATLTPDLGVEYRIQGTYGILIDGTYADWGWKNKSRRYKVWKVSPELRYYIGGQKQVFIGLMYHAGAFNYKLGEKGKKGSYQGGGITGGYVLPLNEAFEIDFHGAVGYTRSHYHNYLHIGQVNVLRAHGVNNYWGINQLGISLIWKLK